VSLDYLCNADGTAAYSQQKPGTSALGQETCMHPIRPPTGTGSRTADCRPREQSAPDQHEELLRTIHLPRRLSPREAEVVSAGLRGLHTKATAAELGLSPKTVDELWRRVYRKIGCSSRIEVLSRIMARALLPRARSDGPL
jgi:DNA-binding CsgD family transcriptional regulator